VGFDLGSSASRGSLLPAASWLDGSCNYIAIKTIQLGKGRAEETIQSVYWSPSSGRPRKLLDDGPLPFTLRLASGEIRRTRTVLVTTIANTITPISITSQENKAREWVLATPLCLSPANCGSTGPRRTCN